MCSGNADCDGGICSNGTCTFNTNAYGAGQYSDNSATCTDKGFQTIGRVCLINGVPNAVCATGDCDGLLDCFGNSARTTVLEATLDGGTANSRLPDNYD